MTEITLSRISELLRSVLELLWNKPEGLSAREIIAIIPQITQLTEYERGYSPPNNIPRYERIVRLATVPLARAGWLVKNNKGRWFITEEGRNACRRYPNAQELYQEAGRIIEAKGQNPSAAMLAAEEAQEKAWEQIQKFIKEKKRGELQKLVAELLKSMGYHVNWIAPPEKDRGQVDIVAHVDPLGAKGGRILVQVKHPGPVVTIEGLQAFLNVMGDNDFGILVSTEGFTGEAKDQIDNDALQKMTLLDLEGFFDLWVMYYEDLSQEARNRLPLKPVHFLHGMDQ